MLTLHMWILVCNILQTWTVKTLKYMKKIKIQLRKEITGKKRPTFCEWTLSTKQWTWDWLASHTGRHIGMEQQIKTFSKSGTLFYKGIHIKRHSVHDIYTHTHTHRTPVTPSSQRVACIDSERHCLASREL